MQKFLSKFLPKEQVDTIMAAYIAANPKATELPIYVSQTRLNEVLSERDSFKNSLDAIPKDWQTQLESTSKKYEEAIGQHKKEMEAAAKEVANAKKDAEIDGKLYVAKAKNIKAVRALIDYAKPIDEEITRLQKEDSYLFGSKKGVVGTGVEDNEDDAGKDPKEGLTDYQMRSALGLPSIDNK